jgi:hypothetical protein
VHPSDRIISPITTEEFAFPPRNDIPWTMEKPKGVAPLWLKFRRTLFILWSVTLVRKLRSVFALLTHVWRSDF